MVGYPAPPPLPFQVSYPETQNIYIIFLTFKGIPLMLSLADGAGAGSVSVNAGLIP